MKRIIRDKPLTPEKAAEYNKIREQVEEELPELIARHEERMASKIEIKVTLDPRIHCYGFDEACLICHFTDRYLYHKLIHDEVEVYPAIFKADNAEEKPGVICKEHLEGCRGNEMYTVIEIPAVPREK